MPGTASWVGLAADGTGKKLKTFAQGGANDEHIQATVLFDKDGNELITSTGVPASADRGLVVRDAGYNRTTGPTALNALNAVVAVEVTGLRGVGFKGVTTTPNFVGSIVPEVSFDGGTTYVQTWFQMVHSTFGLSGFVIPEHSLNSGNETLYWYLLVPGGATHARVRVSAFTSGTLTGTIVATDIFHPTNLSQGKEGLGLVPSGTVVGGTDAGGALRYHRVEAKGTQGVYGLTTQDMKDSGRNLVVYFMILPILTTASEVMMSLTGYKGGVAVAATTQPAVVTTGKRFRLQAAVLDYVATTTVGSARFTLRANLSGLAVIGSPLVIAFNIGGPGGTAGMNQHSVIPLPDGVEFAAGTGIGLGMQGFGATLAAAAAGYGQCALIGYEY